MNTLKIIIATHKQYEFPNASYYVPIQVGKTLTGLELNILSDNTQINISDKNQSYCELTALYWVWKNRFFQDVDYIGLVHYRRYFSGKGLRVKGKTIASENELSTLLKDADCLVPCKRNYYIETVYSHYQHAHYIKDLEAARAVIADKYSDYLNSFDSVMQGKILHLYNMFVIKKSLFEEYCHWLFTILFELEKKIDVSTYDSYQKRVFGFIAERLFNVWLQKNNIKLKEVEVVSLEKQNIIFKVLKFIIRKLMG
jgi:epsF